MVAGFALPRFEQAYLAAFTHGISVASAQAVLSAIASGILLMTRCFTFPSIAKLVMRYCAMWTVSPFRSSSKDCLKRKVK